jgi:acetyl-CoA carboxylase alpha subunit
LQLFPEKSLKFRIVEEILPEPLAGADRNPDAVFSSTKKAILRHLKISAISPNQLLEILDARFGNIGIFSEA